MNCSYYDHYSQLFFSFFLFFWDATQILGRFLKPCDPNGQSTMGEGLWLISEDTDLLDCSWSSGVITLASQLRETLGLSTQSTPRARASVFLFSFHCIDKFPLSVCLTDEKVKLCTIQLTLIFQSWNHRCLCPSAAHTKLLYFYRLDTHNGACT